MKALESFIGSFGILIAGFISIPLVGSLFDVEITHMQGAKMSTTFFLIRWAWLYGLRIFFDRTKEQK